MGKKKANYELAMKDLIYHFFPPKSLQLQKRYLSRDMYKPRYTKIRDFIWYIDEMVEYLEKFPPFGAGQRLQDKNILDRVEFSLPKRWQKERIIQGLDTST